MLGKILSLFSGAGAVSQAAGAAVNVAALLSLAPAVLWFIHHKDEVLTTITYGQAALFGGLLFGIIKIAHYTRPPVYGSQQGE